MTELTISQMAQATVRHLSRPDALFVAKMALQHAARFAVLLSAYAGQEMTEHRFAGLALRIAKRLQTEGGQAS